VQAIDAGAQLVRTRQESDSMRAVLHAEDAALEQELEGLRRYDELAHDGSLPPDLYERYRTELTHYNAHVGERNAKLAAWQEILGRNHEAVNRYNMLSDSIHDIATRMGNPYYAIPTPAEAAIQKGVLRPTPEH
jgi:multidrug resistance efflux pump